MTTPTILDTLAESLAEAMGLDATTAHYSARAALLSLREHASDPGIVEAMQAARSACWTVAKKAGLGPPGSVEINTAAFTAALSHVLAEGEG